MLLRDLEAEVPIGDILAWIEKGPAAALPSGAEAAGESFLEEEASANGGS